jgi:hypothetical protein
MTLFDRLLRLAELEVKLLPPAKIKPGNGDGVLGAALDRAFGYLVKYTTRCHEATVTTVTVVSESHATWPEVMDRLKIPQPPGANGNAVRMAAAEWVLLLVRDRNDRISAADLHQKLSRLRAGDFSEVPQSFIGTDVYVHAPTSREITNILKKAGASLTPHRASHR